MTSLWLALALFTVAPVPAHLVPDPNRAVAGRSLRWLPLVGAGLGVAAGVAASLFWHPVSWIPGAGSPLLGAVVGIAVLAALTRGLHLDGLADVADGLGSRRPAEEALVIMKQSDIGPFGVAVLLLTLLAQVASLSTLFAAGSLAQGFVLLAAAQATGRFAALDAAAPSVPSARPQLEGGFGGLVAGTAELPVRLVIGLLGLAACLVAAGLAGFSLRGVCELAAVLLLSHFVATLFRRHCVRRLGGVTGDVFGALIEVGATVVLLGGAAAVGWSGGW
ncbi:cobalamin-5'-phosphate synthase [Jatrophihabitans sp. GAS493]|uniref:adenosylcobinamide-GDP ribazoletransferase n=1 Tax=Jatrophihabitans sp. GAS493 TaxID=1907575 RepID=UPI000BB7DB26|nr:adenosylcobinamide-GDP ribazoletransferase [Jatrophihabitans sp. GAS493]SOD74485.1 cobalamin-5'-phosphate synthase [Jatrophihabitans sp. GAS493]